MTLRDKQREATVEAILDAATRVFSESGFHRTSMEDIAKACDCAAATLYGYFKGKNAIFLQIMETRVTGYLGGVQAVARDTRGFAAGLSGYLDHFAGFCEKNRDFVRLMDVVMRDPPDTHPDPQAVEAVKAAYLASVESIVQRGLDEGVLREVPARQLAVSLIGLLHANAALWLHGHAQGEVRPLVDFAGDLFLRGAGRER